MTARVCQQHRAPAGWACTTCHALLCPDCTAIKTVLPAEVPACTVCGGIAEVLLRHRSETASLAQRLPGAFRWPLHGDGLLAYLGAVAGLTLTGVLGVQVILGIPATVAALFAVVRSTGRGEEDIEAPEFTDLLSGVGMPVLRFFLVMAPIWGPLAAAVLWASPQPPKVWVLVLLGVLGAMWVPMAFIVAATNSPLTTLLNPVAIVGSAAKLGTAYGLYLGTSAFLAVLGAGLAFLGLLAGLMPIPIASRVLEGLLVLYAPFVGARVAGLTLYLHGDQLEWDSAERFLEPVLGAVVPRGALRERSTASQAAAARSFAPIELDDAPEVASEAFVAPEASARARVLELNAKDLPPLEACAVEEVVDHHVRHLDEATLPTMDEQRLKQLRAVMAGGDGDAALELWRVAPLPGLRGDELGWLGRSAAAKGDSALALCALEAAVEVSARGEERARAMVLLGRLLGERLLREADARSWMERVERELPESGAARFAREWLAARPRTPAG